MRRTDILKRHLLDLLKLLQPLAILLLPVHGQEDEQESLFVDLEGVQGPRRETPVDASDP